MTIDSTLDELPRANGKNKINIVEKNDVTIVIPTLNEEMAIGFVIESLINENYYNILIVDGYSSDATIKNAEQYEVDIIQQHGKGKAGAIKTAIEHVKTPYIVIIDGDYTYDAKDISKFLPHMENYNEIIGSRTNGRENISRLNRFGNWVINKLFNILFGTNLNDVCSGLYALNTTFAKNIVLETQGFNVEVEIAAQTADSGSITEIPINYKKRIGIQKLSPWKDGIKILFTIFKLASVHNSITLYSLLGSFMMIPSICILSWVIWEWINGVWHYGISLLGVMLTIISSQSLVLSAIASQQRRMEQRIMQKLLVR